MTCATDKETPCEGDRMDDHARGREGWKARRQSRAAQDPPTLNSALGTNDLGQGTETDGLGKCGGGGNSDVKGKNELNAVCHGVEGCVAGRLAGRHAVCPKRVRGNDGFAVVERLRRGEGKGGGTGLRALLLGDPYTNQGFKILTVPGQTP